MKILVTGGAGFIGSNMVYSLEKKEHDIVIVDNLSTGKYENLDQISDRTKFYLQDIRNSEMDKVFAIEKPEVVIHLAAQASVIASVEDPMLDEDINLKGIINLLNQCVKYQVKKFIFISTGGAIYGDATIIPTSEDYVPDVISPYALTKFTSESYIKIYHRLYGLKFTILRLANVYGPRQVPKGECGVIPIYFEKCLNHKDADLYTYRDLPKGVTRDYVYIDDVCRAIELCLTNGDGEIINIGTGKETYTKEIFDLVKQISGSEVCLHVGSERVGDVRRGVLEISKAKKVLSWRPEMDLIQGLEKTYQSILEGVTKL